MTLASARLLLEVATTRSRWLRFLLDRRPALREELASTLHAPFGSAEMRAFLAREPLTGNTVKAALRRLRTRVFAHVAARDLAGLAALPEVMETMTRLADLAVTMALEVLRPELAERHGEPRSENGGSQDLIVVGMGKLGGRELNVSSDIDLIFVYPEEGDTAGPASISNFEFYTRLGRRLIETLGEITGDGQVFRVDMRLRPNGDSGPLVASFEMLENYFITQGREWERYAWIKARPIGESPRHEELAAIVRPFVFRRYLDFGALNAMRELHAQIRREVARRDMANHIKLGPGGIREIEFIAQVFQLIRGGRDTVLRIKPTLAVLTLLAERATLSRASVQELTAAYSFLRRLEHRLQYLDDQQTHSLPEKREDQAVIAAAMGFANFDALLEELDDHRASVSRHFEAVFADPNRAGHALAPVWLGADDSEAAAQELTRLGYREPAPCADRLRAIRGGSRYRQLAPQIRCRFDALIPPVVEAASRRPNPDDTLLRVLDLLEAISRRGAYLALLQQYPQALDKVVQMMSSSSWAAGYLTGHPLLLDELLDARLLETAPDWRAFHAELAELMDRHEPDTERQMDLMREAHHAQVFRLLALDLAGRVTLEKLADHLSDLADIMLDLTIVLAWRKLRTRHRDEPRFAVIAYGKLGGKELGYASDLDLVFLYDDDAPEAQETYARLGQRISTWLNSRTAAGILFETDLRLRPSGEAGLLVSSIDAFRRYQAEAAWVWEHQALTRARYCAGDRRVGEQFAAIRIEVLRRRRDLEHLRREVLAMRQRMIDAHANKSALFDLKHDGGGLIDVEFIVQYLVLGYAHRHPELTANRGNIALLGIAAGLGLIPVPLADEARDAYREYRRLQHGLRLNNARYARVEPQSVAPQRAAVLALWREVFGES